MHKIVWDNIHSRTNGLSKRFLLGGLVLFAGVTAIFSYGLYENRAEPINQTELSSLIIKNIDCREGLNTVKRMRVTQNDVEGSISLLSYRANCLIKLGRYDESVEALQVLKRFYELKSDGNRIEVVESQILKAQTLKSDAPQDSIKSNKESQKRLEVKPRG